MICAISKKSEYLLAELIQQMIKTSGKYELDDVIKQIYERVKEQTKNEDTALAYAGLVPSLALKIFVYNPQLRKEFKVSMDKIDEKIDLFSDFENVRKELLAKAPVPAKPVPMPPKGDDYQIVNMQAALNLKASERVMGKKRVKYATRPSYWATRGTDIYYDRPDGSGVQSEEVFHFDVMRKLLGFLKNSPPSDRTVSIPGVGKVYLKAVQLYAFAATEKVKDNLEVQIKDGKVVLRNTNEGSDWTPSENDIIYALVDGKGNYVYFDNNGNVTKDRVDGRVPYYSVVSGKRYDDFKGPIENHHAGIRYNKKYSDLTDDQKKEVDQILNGQKMVLSTVEKYAMDNPGKGLLFSIWGGSEGYLPVDTENGLLDFDFKSQPFVPQIGTSGKDRRAYFVYNGNTYYIQPRPGLSLDDTSIAMRLIFDKVFDQNLGRALTVNEKKEILSRMFYPGNNTSSNVLIDIQNLYVEMNNDGSIKTIQAKYDPNTKQYEKGLKNRTDITSLPNASDIVADIINNFTYYHVNKTYSNMGMQFISPKIVTDQEGRFVVDKTEPINYGQWLLSKGKYDVADKTEVAKGSDPYLLFEPTVPAFDYVVNRPEKVEVPKPGYTVEKSENGLVYGNQDKLRDLHNKGVALYTMRVSKGQTKSNLWGFKGLSDTKNFGNPFTGTDAKGVIPMADIPTATAAYEAWLDGQILFTDKNGVEHDLSSEAPRRDWINKKIEEFRAKGGVTLGYFKKGYRSHADVLGERINKPADLDYNDPQVIDLLNELQDKTRELEVLQLQEGEYGIDLEESSVAVFTARRMPKITPESAKKETGLKTGAKQDINPALLSKKGVTVSRAAEELAVAMKDEYLVEASADEIRDHIIEILQVGKNKFLENAGVAAPKEISRLKSDIKKIEDALEEIKKGRPASPVGITDRAEAPPTRTDVISEPGVNDNIDPLSQAADDTWNKIAPLKSAEVPATKEQLADALKWYEEGTDGTGSVFKKAGIPFKTLFNIFNSDAVATFSKAGITLYAGSDYSDIYHESWHAFTYMFLTEEQRSKLWNEIRKYEGSFTDYNGNKVEFSKATDDQIEEYLAEDFRGYMLSNGTKLGKSSPQKRSIFKKIYDFLKTLYGDIKQFLGLAGRKKAADVANNPLEFKNIKELYENIRIGNLGGMTRRQDVRDFGTVNKSLRYLNESDDQKAKFSHADSMLVFETIESVMSRLVDEANRMSGNSRRTVTMYTDEQNRQKAYGYVYRQFEQKILPALEQKLAEAKNDTTRKQIQKKIDLVKDVLANFGNREDLKENAKLGAGVIYFHMMHSKIVSEEAKKDFFEDELDRKEQNLFQDKGPQDLALEELASEDVIRLVRSLNLFDEKGNKKLNSLGEPKLMEFKDAFNRIMKVTLGNIDKEKMRDKMIEASEKNAMFRQLLEKLGPLNSTEDTSQKLWTNFWQAFNKSRVKLVQHTVKETVEEGENTYNLTVGYADSQGMKVQQNWSNAFSGSPTNYIKRKTGDYKGGNRNYLDVKAVLMAFPNVDQIRNNPEKAYNFLKSIGAVMTDTPMIKTLLTNVNLYKETLGYIYNQLQRLSMNDITIDSFDAIFEDHTLKNGEQINGIMGRLNNLTELEASEGNTVSNYMVGTATGDTAFEASLNNTMLVKTYYINGAPSFQELTDLPHMNHLAASRTPFTSTSLWKRSMFDQDGKRRKVEGMDVGITIDNLSGVKMIYQNGLSEGVATLNSNPFEKFIMEFHSVLMKGTPELSRHGDKKTSNTAYVENVQSYDTRKIQSFKFIDDVDFMLNDSLSAPVDPLSIDSAGNRRFFEIMLGYIASEMARIKIMREMPDDAVFDHNYKNRGKDFFIFDRMLSPEVKTELIAMTGNTTLMNSFFSSPDVMNAFRGYLMSQRNDLHEMMRKDVHSYLTAKAQENKKFMPDNMRFIDQALYEKFIGVTVQKSGKQVNRNNIKRENMTEALFHSYTANSWINAYETSVWFYGDPAQFDQWQKRIQGEASTGDLSATDQATIDFVNGKGRPYSQKVLAEIDPSLTPYEIPTSGVINTTVLGDSKVNLPKPIADKVEKALISYYEKVYPKQAKQMTKNAMDKYNGITEGDGQAWVTFDGYRAIKFSQGKWFDYHEDLYQRIMKGENIDAEKIEQFFPVAKWQHMGPMAIMEGLPMNAMYKFSVFPLIPNVIKDRTLDILHKTMIKQKVDMVLLKSGSKVANLTRGGKMDPFYKDNKTRTFDSNIDLLKTPIFLHYLKDQQETGDEFKKKVTFPTQQRVLITDDLFENGVPLDFKTGLSEEKRIEEWKVVENNWNKYSEKQKEKISPMYVSFKNYKDHVDSFTKVLEMQLLRKIGWRYDKNNNLVGNTKKLMEYAVRTLSAQDVADHLLDFIKINEKGQLATDLSLSINSAQIQKLMHALVNKEIIRQKANGEALVQVSRMGWEKPTQEQYENYNGGDLPFYTYDKEGDNTKPMKVKIAIQGQFMNLLNHPDVITLAKSMNIDRLAALNMKIKDEAWLNEGNNRSMITMVSTRIPVQGMNSMDFMEIAEFLPQDAGGIIIMPESIVGKSGSDFDIDKMFTLMPYILAKMGMVDFVSSKDVKSLDEIDKLTQDLVKKEAQVKQTRDSYQEKITALKKGATDDIALELEQIESEVMQRYAYPMKKINDNIDKFEKLLKKVDAGKISDENAVGIQDSLYDAYQEREQLQEKMDSKILKIATSAAIKNLIEERNQKLKPLLEQVMDINRSIHAGSVQGITNGLIGSMKSLMERPENFVNLVVPNSTDILDPVVNKMEKYAINYDPTYGTGKISGTTLFETPFNINVQQTSSVAKRSLGIAAVGNVSKVRMNQIGMHLSPTNRRDMSLKDFKIMRKRLEQISDLLESKEDFKEKKALQKEARAIVNNIKGEGRIKRPFALQRVMLPSNTVQVNGETAVSLGARFSKDGSQKTADVHNQIINVAVDVVKDPRAIFTIQGNLELIPVLELLIDSGVDLETAVMFLMQPLIQEYKRAEAIRKGPLAALFGVKSSKMMLRYDAKKEVVRRHDIVPMFTNQYGEFIDKFAFVTRTLDLIDQNKGMFTNKALEDRLVSYYDNKRTEISDADKAVLLHFFELQEMAKASTGFKLTMNPDKSRAKNLLQVEERKVKIDDIRKNERIPEEIIDREYRNGLLSSFYQAMEFQQEVFKDYFKIDNNKEVFEAVRMLMDDNEDGFGAPSRTGYDSEEMVSKAVNDFKVNLFQMALYDFDINDMDSYRGYMTSDDLKVVAKRGVVFGVYFQDGIAYVDKKKLKKDFDNLAAANKDTKLAPVNNSTFSYAKDYYRFVFEREFLRYTHPMEQAKENFLFKSMYNRIAKKNSDKTSDEINEMTYEEYLRDRALKNTFNINHMFMSQTNTMADMLALIKKSFPELVSENGYEVLKNLDTYFDKNGSKNIRLYGTKPTGDMQTSYQEELLDLMDPMKMEKVGEDVSMADKMIIADFFNKLPIYSVLQSGFDIDANLSIQSVVPQDQVTQIMVAVTEPFTRENNPLEFTPELISDFVERFVTQNALSNRTRRNFKNYNQPVAVEEYYSEEPPLQSIQVDYGMADVKKAVIFEKDVEGKTVFSMAGFNEKDEAGAVALEKEIDSFFSSLLNKDKVLVFNDVYNPKAVVDPNRSANRYDWVLRRLASKYPQNIIGIPTRAAYSGSYSNDKISETDPKYMETLSQAMDNLEDMALQGKEIIFNKGGYAQNQIGHSEVDGSAPGKAVLNPGIQVFDTVSKQLFRRFGYENPNFMKKGIGPIEFIEDIQRPLIEEMTMKRMPTHEEIMNKLKSCLK